MPQPARIIDLDALAPPDITVRLAGETYSFPGDCPLPVFLRVQGLQQRVDDGAAEDELVDEITGAMLDLFRVRQPAMEHLPDGIGVTTLMGLVGTLYGEPDPDAEVEPDPPVPARSAAGGTRSTNPPRKRPSSPSSRR